jgi:hypothetical protein
VEQLGNAHGEILEVGRVPDCYLGLLLDPAAAAAGVGVLVVTSAALLHPVVLQPQGVVLHELLRPSGSAAAGAGVCDDIRAQWTA